MAKLSLDLVLRPRRPFHARRMAAQADRPFALAPPRQDAYPNIDHCAAAPGRGLMGFWGNCRTKQ